MTQAEVTNEELGSIGISRGQQLKVRRRTLPGVPPMLELSNWNEAVGHHLACPFPDNPQVISALIGALQAHLKDSHGTA